MELTLNTYSECVESFRAADKLMGTAFRQLVQSINTARDFYIEQNSGSENPEWGFQTQFAADCGSERSFVTYIDNISQHPEIVTAVTNYSNLSFRAVRKLLGVDSDTREAALAELEQTGELTEPRIIEIETELSEFEERLIDREIELERLERENRARQRALESLVPSDSNIDQLVTLIISGGQQLDSYCSKTNSAVEPEKFATFVANRLIDLSDSCGSDPEVYTSSLESIKIFIGLVASALDRVPTQRDSHLKLVK